MTRAQRRVHFVVWLVIVPLALIALASATSMHRGPTTDRPLATQGTGR